MQKLFETIIRESEYEDKEDIDLYYRRMEKSIAAYISQLSAYHRWNEKYYEKNMKDILNWVPEKLKKIVEDCVDTKLNDHYARR